MLNENFSLARQFFQSREGRRRYFTPDPESCDAKIVQNCSKPAQMVLMRVRQRDKVQLLKSPRPQIRRHGFFARVDTIVFFVPGKAPERSAAIDQQSFP